MNAEGLNTSHKEEGDANDTAKLLGESESKYVDEGDEKTTGNPGEDTKVLNVEPKTEEELLFCKFCEFQAKNLTKYVNHVHRPSHIKKAADAYNIRVTKDSETPKIFNCQLCVISCNGENAWNQHLLGQKHRKVLEKKSMDTAEAKQVQRQFYNTGGPVGPVKTNYYGNLHNKKPYEKIQRTVQQPNRTPSQPLGARDFANYSEPLIGLEYVTEIQVIGQSPRYQCSLCDAKFDHNLKFPHLVGAKHRMNVLKIKRPNVIKDPSNHTQKRSELTAMLLRESVKLELEEGRQQVKTKVEQSPFISVNNHPTVPGRGGSTRGASTFRGNRGEKGDRGTYSQGTRGNRGTYSQGTRGNRGTYTQGTRGNRGTYSQGTRGGTYRGRGRGTSWSGTYGESSQDYSYSSNFVPPAEYNYSDMPYNASYDRYNSSFNYQQVSPSVTTDFTHRPESFPPPSPERFLPPPQSRPSPVSTTATAIQAEDKSQPDLSAGLAGALGDLTKLVQNEDDASVALHVSNALTQALLQFRMTNIQEEASK